MDEKSVARLLPHLGTRNCDTERPTVAALHSLTKALMLVDLPGMPMPTSLTENPRN